MLKNDKRIFPLDLQFFADEGGDGNNPDDGQNGSNDKDSGNGSGEQDKNAKTEKTFTQEQVNAMMAKEKNAGKHSVLKNLGFTNEEEAKKAVDLYNALVNSQKSQEELQQKELEKLNTENQDYIRRAEEAESKLFCFEAGVDKSSVDDVLAIAKTKMTETKDLKTVLEEMKKEQRYSVFFESTSSKGGTGSDPGHSSGSKPDNAGEYGKRLAERNATHNQGEKKSSFF